MQIVAASQPALERGITVGMTVAEARGLLNQSQRRRAPATYLYAEPHDARADRMALAQLAEWCEQFSPLVGLEDADLPETLLLDVTGLAALYGSEEKLVARVAEQFSRRGLTVCLALADTVGAAWALSHYKGDELPIAALRLSAQTLAWLTDLGIRTIEQLATLPRAGLAQRFGDELLRRWDQMTGAAAEVIVAHRPAPQFEADVSFEFATDRPEQLEAIIAHHVERILARLATRGLGIQKLVCELRCEGGRSVPLMISLFRATGTLRHLMELVRLRLEKLSLMQPVSGLRISATVVGPLEYRQQELFADVGRESAWGETRELAALIDRLSSRLGYDAVLRAKLCPDPQPEYACRYEAWIDAQPSRSRPEPDRAALRKLRPQERPLRLAREPVALAVAAAPVGGLPPRFRLAGREHVVAHHWGPERIETGWWRGRSVRRDYYRIETATGHRWWIFRRLHDRQWFVQGWFD